MRVAMLCPNFPPEFQGGTERVTLALARALQAQGNDVAVITGSEQPWDGEDVGREDALGVPVHRIRRHPNEVYGIEEMTRPRVLSAVEGVLREHRADVVHLHHWATLSIDVLRAARRRGLATVATLHDMWVSCPRFFRRPPPGVDCPEGGGRASCGPCVHIDMSGVPVWSLRHGIANRDRDLRGELDAAGVVTAPSASCARSIASFVPWDGPIEVVPHGLLEPVRRELESGAPGQPLKIGTFGNLVAEKGVGQLVEAMAGIGGAELHLFGPFLAAEFEARVRELADRGSVALTCHGAFDAREGHPARKLDLAVFPSLCQETYGLVVEEALARGVPVVVSDAGALAERIGDGGLVVPTGDVESLRAVLTALVEDRGRYDALVAGIPRQFAQISDAAQRYRELYDVARRACA